MPMRNLPCFEDLVTMAQKEPDALNQLLKDKTEEMILAAPEKCQPRLIELQLEIDAQRQTASNPTDSMITLSKMMTDSFSRLNQVLNQSTGKLKTKTKTAQIIPFKR